MLVRIRKNFHVALPKELADALGFFEGDRLNCTIWKGALLLKPAVPLEEKESASPAEDASLMSPPFT